MLLPVWESQSVHVVCAWVCCNTSACVGGLLLLLLLLLRMCVYVCVSLCYVRVCERGGGRNSRSPSEKARKTSTARPTRTHLAGTQPGMRQARGAGLLPPAPLRCPPEPRKTVGKLHWGMGQARWEWPK